MYLNKNTKNYIKIKKIIAKKKQYGTICHIENDFHYQ